MEQSRIVMEEVGEEGLQFTISLQPLLAKPKLKVAVEEVRENLVRMEQ